MPRHWASYAERADKTGREETEGARALGCGPAMAFKWGWPGSPTVRARYLAGIMLSSIVSLPPFAQEQSWRRAQRKKMV